MSDDLLDDYAAGGFGGALQPGNKPALLLVDVIMAYLTPTCGLYSPRFEDEIGRAHV